MKIRLGDLRAIIRESIRDKRIDENASYRNVRRVLLEYPEGTCAKCGNTKSSGKKFCGKCGSKMGVCPNPDCGAALNDKPTQKFCIKCGTKFSSLSSLGDFSEKGADVENDNVQKIKSMMKSMETSWDAATKRNEASKALDAAHSNLLNAYMSLMRAYDNKTPNALETAKEKYAAAKNEVIAAAAKDEETFSAWIQSMEKSGMKPPKDLIDAEMKLRSTRAGIINKGDQDISDMDKALAKFKSDVQKVADMKKIAGGLSKLPPKPTGDYEKDLAAYRDFLNSNEAAVMDNGLYLSYVAGFFRRENLDIVDKILSTWKVWAAEAEKEGLDWGEDKGSFPDETLNDMLDKIGGDAAEFKK